MPESTKEIRDCLSDCGGWLALNKVLFPRTCFAHMYLGVGFEDFSMFTLGRWSNLTNIFQPGWNHQGGIYTILRIKQFKTVKLIQRFEWHVEIWLFSDLVPLVNFHVKALLPREMGSFDQTALHFHPTKLLLASKTQAFWKKTVRFSASHTCDITNTNT